MGNRASQRGGFDVEVRLSLLETDVDGIYEQVRQVETKLTEMETAADERNDRVMNRINAILVAFTTTALLVAANIVYNVVTSGVTP